MFNFYKQYPCNYNYKENNSLNINHESNTQILTRHHQPPNSPECLENSHCNHTKKAKPLKKKFNFKTLKKDTCSSLNEVECFLNNFTDFIKYIKLINLIKK